MSSDNAIEFTNVWKRYSTRAVLSGSLGDQLMGLLRGESRSDELIEGEFWALRDISFAVRKGESLGIYGPNGSGKSTILKLIAYVTHPNLGSVEVAGRVAPLISLGAGFHPDLTGRENIFMNGTMLGMSINEIKDKIGDIIEFTEIEEKFIDMPLIKYSTGMHIRLGFSVAVHSDAEILLIDETLAVGDVHFKRKCVQKIEELRTNRTLIIVLHQKKLLESVTDRLLFIEKGSLTEYQGAPEG